MSFKWVLKKNQDVIANISYKISKHSPKNMLEIKHKVSASKLKFHKNMQKSSILTFRHQNKIPLYKKNIIKWYENKGIDNL